jgi:hypothetical protein
LDLGPMRPDLLHRAVHGGRLGRAARSEQPDDRLAVLDQTARAVHSVPVLGLEVDPGGVVEGGDDVVAVDGRRLRVGPVAVRLAVGQPVASMESWLFFLRESVQE